MLSRLFNDFFKGHSPAKHPSKLAAEAARTRGDWPAAKAAYRLYLVDHPDDAEAQNDLGTIHCELGEFDQAQVAFSTAIRLEPGLFSAHMNLGTLALQQRRAYRDALAHFRQAFEIHPDQPVARQQLSLACYELGEVEEALRILHSAKDLEGDPVAAEYTLFITNAVTNHDPHEHFEAHRRWAARLERETGAQEFPRRSLGRKGRAKIRVGYVSADFREHAVVRFLLPILERHDRSEFEVFCYSNGTEADDITAAIRNLPLIWRGVHALGDPEFGEVVTADGIDILVDLSGHTRGNRLGAFALKPAPVQATWLGYLNTTGLGAMDYRITDSLLDPPKVSDAFHTETLLRLEPSGWCYRAAEDAPAIGPLPCKSKGHVTFGSFNHVAKLTPEVLAVWAQLLKYCTGSRLKICGVPDGQVAARLTEPFVRMGIDPDRLQLLPRLPRSRFHAEIADTDIALDPFPYCGGATTCESLWMGLPVIALAGDFGFSRSSSAILAQVGLTELVANSVDDYLRNAASLADGDLLTTRKSMRDRMRSSELMNEAGFVGRLEEAYRKLAYARAGA